MITTSGDGLTKLFVLVLFLGGVLVWLLLRTTSPAPLPQNQIAENDMPAHPGDEIADVAEANQQQEGATQEINQEIGGDTDLQDLKERVQYLEIELANVRQQVELASDSAATVDQLAELETMVNDIHEIAIEVDARIADLESAKIPSLQQKLNTTVLSFSTLETAMLGVKKHGQNNTLATGALLVLNILSAAYFIRRINKTTRATEEMARRYGRVVQSMEVMRKKLNAQGVNDGKSPQARVNGNHAKKPVPHQNRRQLRGHPDDISKKLLA